MVITIGSVLVTVVSYSMFMLRCFPCRSCLYLALSFFGIYYHSYPWGAIYFLLALAERLVAQQDFLVSINNLWCSRREQECFAHHTKGEGGSRCEDFNGLPEVLVKAPFGDSEEVIVGVVDAGEVGGRD